MALPCLWAALACVVTSAPAAAQSVERIGEIRVHGNHATPDAVIVELAGLIVGEPALPERLRGAEEALRASGRFAAVELRRRFRSLTDPSDILIVIVVDEHIGATRSNPTPGTPSRMLHSAMWLPLLRYAEGYGVTFGARVSAPTPLGAGGRLSVPLTWGGERRAAVEMERAFAGGVISRARVSASLSQSIHPLLDGRESRRDLSASAERGLTTWLRAEATARFSSVRFGPSLVVDYPSMGLFMTADTRVDPLFPRNAVYVTAAAETLGLPIGARRGTVDVRGFVGVGGPAVLALRAKAVKTSAPLPPFEETLVGGGDSLRGYRAGYGAGDNAVLASAEGRWPISSPLSVARVGVKAFVDVAATWSAGERLRDRRFARGGGIGVYAGGPAVNAGVDVGWPYRPRTAAGTPDSTATRWHFTLAVGF